jgi:hypothetical protein
MDITAALSTTATARITASAKNEAGLAEERVLEDEVH